MQCYESGSVWFRIILGSRILIRIRMKSLIRIRVSVKSRIRTRIRMEVKSRIRIGINVKIQKLWRLKMEPFRPGFYTSGRRFALLWRGSGSGSASSSKWERRIPHQSENSDPRQNEKRDPHQRDADRQHWLSLGTVIRLFCLLWIISCLDLVTNIRIRILLKCLFKCVLSEEGGSDKFLN